MEYIVEYADWTKCVRRPIGVVICCRRKASADKDLAPIIEESRKKAGLFKGQPIKLTPEEIVQFIFFPVVNEGCRVIDEGIVDKPSDLDVATVMSMGFPAYRYYTTYGRVCCAETKPSS